MTSDHLMNEFEQDAKQFCAGPDKNNNMNLTLDIDRKIYFPPIWWKQPVSINKIGILKTASTVLDTYLRS